jgi:regulator of sigma E protease
VTTTLIAFVVVIGPLILIHELGHFLVARFCGVGVERFSIGFGPVLLRWRGRETEYCLSAIPMGGYVKMMGEENPLEGGGGAYDPAKAFAGKPLWARFLIVFAGPGMNFVLAWAIFALMLGTVGRPVWPAAIGRVETAGPGAAAGLRTGDTVLAANGEPIRHWEEFERAVAGSDGRALTLRVRRDGGEQSLTVTPVRRVVTEPIFRETRQVWDLGVTPHFVPEVSSIGPDSPAERAGLKPGDVVTSIAGQPVYTRDDVVEAIRGRPGQTFPLTVQRGDTRLTLTVTPERVQERGPDGGEVTIGRIQAGFGIRAVSWEAYGPIDAVGHGVARTWDLTVIILKGLGKLVTGSLDRSNIGGPIQIAIEAGRQYKEGPSALVNLIALISINLAILNLLPVPMLDGGHLLFFVIEAVLGRPLSVKKREAAQHLGFVLLMLLMVYAFYNDLVRLDAFRIFR